jgi:hypothetical protein
MHWIDVLKYFANSLILFAVFVALVILIILVKRLVELRKPKPRLIKPVDFAQYEFAAELAVAEIVRARSMFGPMYNMHEGYAIILEETDEVKEIVWQKQKARDLVAARKEAIQCAAMWLAFAVEVCNEERGRI